MWYGLRTSSELDPDLADSAAELLKLTTRSLIVTIGGLYLALAMMSTVTSSHEVGWRIFVIGIVIALTHVAALLMLPRQTLIAQIIWLVGVFAGTTLALERFQQPELGFFYALLPFLAAVTIGWQAGLLAEIFLIALLWWFSTGSPIQIPLSHRGGIVFGGAIAGVLGWRATNALLTAIRWSLFYSRQARENVEEARDRQLELEETQKDLILANQELARLSDRLKVMYHIAEEARRAKEEFVANVSHELRTPLNMIIGFSEIITQSPDVYGRNLPPALLADIDAIQRNSQHLADLVDDVLDLSQVEAGRMAFSKEWVSLKQVADTAALVVRALFESKGLYLEKEMQPDLPPVLCDKTRIRQVIINLLSNAGRFTEQGGVTIRAWHEQNEIVISVTDTGPGIALEDQQQLFQPFQPLDGSISRRYGGSGLGLSISKRFVEMHGGRMWLESEAGMGATFYFSLPLELPVSTTLAQHSGAMRWLNPDYEYKVRDRQSKAPAPVASPRFVLLDRGETLERLFNRYMGDVETASVQDIEAAIDELNRSPAQALVVNASPSEEMPLNRLEGLPYGTPLMTCWIAGQDETEKRLGVVRYLVKPVTREMLLTTLEGLGEGVASVLLVDDNPEVLRLFTRMLSSAERRYQVLRTSNGSRALSLMRERRPDVVVLDLVMPGMDGFQVLRAKEQDPAIQDIPIIVLSAKDPMNEPVVSDSLTVAQSGGLSAPQVLTCIRSISEMLSGAPSASPADQELSEKPAE